MLCGREKRTLGWTPSVRGDSERGRGSGEGVLLNLSLSPISICFFLLHTHTQRKLRGSSGVKEAAKNRTNNCSKSQPSSPVQLPSDFKQVMSLLWVLSASFTKCGRGWVRRAPGDPSTLVLWDSSSQRKGTLFIGLLAAWMHRHDPSQKPAASRGLSSL